ncbi:MAG: TIR domain-containing protein [Leptolyngbya sp. SIO3F4]|nr:TIR domain-containing protein [Leptolyngbya sp. SIO3F4]
MKSPVAIFISYRLSDSAAETGRVYDRLCKDFPQENIFKDQISIKGGSSFPEAIKQGISSCKVMLVIMTQNWRTAKGDAGTTINNADDWVRREIELALELQTDIIPVFLNGASMPHPNKLPNSLQPLTQLKGIKVDVTNDNCFSRDMSLLVAQVQNLINARQKKALTIQAKLSWISEKINAVFNPSFYHSRGSKLYIFCSISALLSTLLFGTHWFMTKPIIIKVLQERSGHKYYYDLLELALQESSLTRNFIIKEIELEGSQISELIQTDDKKIDVVWMMTNKARESYAKPIRFPLTQGLLGYRICLIEKDNKEIFSDISSLNDFIENKYSIGQVSDWPDTRILREAGIKVKEYETRDSIVHQLEAEKDIDCFARGATEIINEVTLYKNLIVDDNIYFIYRSPIYFFVHRENKELAEIIENGLMTAMDNGKFCRLLMDEYSNSIKKLNFSERRQFFLSNEALPTKTPSNLYMSFDNSDYPESRGECK